MVQIVKKCKQALGVIVAMAFIVLPAAPAHAQLFEGSVDEACKGAALSDFGGCDEAEATNQVNTAVEQGINLFSIVIGLVGVIMIIIAGVKYITSSGDPNSINSAKNTLLYAIIGLVVAALAQVVVRFVLTRA